MFVCIRLIAVPPFNTRASLKELFVNINSKISKITSPKDRNSFKLNNKPQPQILSKYKIVNPKAPKKITNKFPINTDFHEDFTKLIRISC